MAEKNKYKIIKELVDKKGNKNRAGLKLGLSRRQINRLIIGYKQKGKSFFEHGNKGRKPLRTLDQKTRNLIVNMYQTKYYSTNFVHYSELLEQYEKIKVCPNTINSILNKENILSPRARKTTKRNLKNKLKLLKKEAKTKKQLNKIQTKLMAIEEAHPRRPRCKYFGEMLQADASVYNWFGELETQLHIAVDDHSGKIVGAYFDEQETLNGYYNVLYQILKNYGIPAMFFTDKRTVFEYKRKESSSLQEDTFTQFGYACKQLGIEIKTSSVPQAKGRVERMFQTLQSRLPVELRLANITTIQEANKFLKEYIQEFNLKFSLPINNNQSVFEKQPDNEKINLLLSIISKRKIDAGNSIKYKNKYYKLVDKNSKSVYYRKGTNCLVIMTFDGKLFATVDETIHALKEIPKHESFSKKFDVQKPVFKEKRIYIPPMNHPWRKQYFDKYLNTQVCRT